mgnify:CR=1 FL=1
MSLRPRQGAAYGSSGRPSASSHASSSSSSSSASLLRRQNDAQIEEIEALIRAAIADGTRVILATHDLGQARRMATDALFLVNGELVEQAPSPQFFDAPKSAQARAFQNGDIIE